jgi:hypothetical protein
MLIVLLHQEIDVRNPRRRAAREELASGADPPGVGGTIGPFA